MRESNLRVAALACAAAFALLAACKAPDGAGNSSAGRNAPNTMNAANTAARSNTANANVAGPPFTNRPAAPPGADSHAHAADTSGVRRVTIAELRQMLVSGAAVAVDVRGPEAYKQGHIKGALSMPHEEVTARARELPKDKLIVFYCA